MNFIDLKVVMIPLVRGKAYAQFPLDFLNVKIRSATRFVGPDLSGLFIGQFNVDTRLIDYCLIGSLRAAFGSREITLRRTGGARGLPAINGKIRMISFLGSSLLVARRPIISWIL